MLNSFTPLQIAFVLGGKVCGAGVKAPLPDHAPDDCALSVMPNHAGDYDVDPPTCRAYVEEKMGLARAAAPIKTKPDWIEQALAVAPGDDNNVNINDPPTDTKLEPDIATINKHLFALFSPKFAAAYPDGKIEIAFGHPAYKDGAVNKAEIFSVFDLEKAATFAARQNVKGNSVYVAPALRMGSHTSGRAKGEHVITSQFAWCEFDKAGDAERVAASCKANLLWPAMIVTTGTTPDLRQQLYFAVEGVPTPQNLTDMGEALKTLFNTDAVHNADRVLRLGGSINWPTQAKIERGYQPELTKLRLVPESPQYPIEKLRGLGKLAKENDGRVNHFEQAGSDQTYKPGRTDDEITALLERTRGVADWHTPMLRAIASLIGYGWSDFQIRMSCAPYCTKGVNDKDLDPMIDKKRIEWGKPNPDNARQQERIDNAPIDDTKKARARFALVNINDITIDDEELWLIDEIIPAGPSFGLIFGTPKAGKSFAVADMLFHLTINRPYYGHAVRPGTVVYVTSEGVRGFRRRMVAMRRHYEVEGDKVPFYVVNDMPRMGTNSGDAEILAKKIKAAVPEGTVIAAVAIDTLARAMTGANDSDSKDMGIFVANADAIAGILGCFVAAVHHSPRSDPTRGRGSNAADGAADVLISVVKNADGTSTATIEELKDGEGSLYWRFRIVGTELQGCIQNHGCAGVLHPIGNVTKKASDDDDASKASSRLTPTEGRFRSMLAEALLDVGELVPGSGLVPPVPLNIKAVTRFQLKKSLQNAGFFVGHAEKSISAAMSKQVNNLAGKHAIGANKTHVWLPE